MGTRADFYVGIGKDAEWIGSIAYDGYRVEEMTLEQSYKDLDSMECWAIKSATSEAEFRRAVAKLIEMNNDGTKPEQGWPWPWANSETTDYAYNFYENVCESFHWGKKYDSEGNKSGDDPEWPDMRSKQNITFGDRSGLLVIKA